jgi:hypothetical protein
MSERVEQFLITLSQDPVLLDNFLDDPEPVLMNSPLTGEERDLLKSGDAELIRKYLGDKETIFATASTVTGTGPKPGPPPPPPKKPKG